MGICVEIECPKCHKDFVVSPSMMRPQNRLIVWAGTESQEIRLHCPHCDTYFPKEEAARVWGSY
jgi:hypothetical protein